MAERTDGLRVVVIDDHDLLRRGVISALTLFPGIEVVGEARDGVSGLEVVLELSPDVVLMDLVMPNGSGVDAIREIKQARPDIQILALTSFAEGGLVREAMSAGATSYVMKNVDASALADAVRMTSAGQSTLAPEVTQQLILGERGAPTVLEDLTDRESEVAELLSLGRSNAQIAAALGVSLYTIKNHVSNVLMKLRVSSRTEAAALILNERADPGR